MTARKAMGGVALDDLAAEFEISGPAAIATLRRYDPACYIRAIEALVRDDDTEVSLLETLA